MAEAPIAPALAAGVLAAVNPRGFALLPAYLALLVRGEAGAALARRRARSRTATIMSPSVRIPGGQQ